MSDEIAKYKNSKRRHKDQVAIDKQIDLAKNYGYHKTDSDMNKWKYLTQPHRNHKKHIFNCGDPKCTMCANPRKVFKEKTIQEKRFEQRIDHERENAKDTEID
jgi:hypothetical protein